MSLTENNGMYMPVAPAYGSGSGFGGGWGDGIWLILIVLFALGGGMGFGGFGGGFGGGYDFPWLLNGQQQINANTNGGFRDAMLNDGITSIRDGISGLSTQLCNTGSTIQMALANGFAGVEQGANARQMADMQQMFGIQSSLQNCCCENRASVADLKYTVATEACADRAAVSSALRDVIEAQTASTQRILDQMCNDKIDAKNEKIADLQNQLNMATLRESQVAQNAFIQQGFANEVDQLYNRLSTCPVPSTPVYGRTPIFTCNNGGCGCNGGAFYN